jgi:hypothetical protein
MPAAKERHLFGKLRAAFAARWATWVADQLQARAPSEAVAVVQNDAQLPSRQQEPVARAYCLAAVAMVHTPPRKRARQAYTAHSSEGVRDSVPDTDDEDAEDDDQALTQHRAALGGYGAVFL